MSKRTHNKLSSRISKKTNLENEELLKGLGRKILDSSQINNKTIEKLRLLDSWTEEPVKLSKSYLGNLEKPTPNSYSL